MAEKFEEKLFLMTIVITPPEGYDISFQDDAAKVPKLLQGTLMPLGMYTSLPPDSDGTWPTNPDTPRTFGTNRMLRRCVYSMLIDGKGVNDLQFLTVEQIGFSLSDGHPELEADKHEDYFNQILGNMKERAASSQPQAGKGEEEKLLKAGIWVSELLHKNLRDKFPNRQDKPNERTSVNRYDMFKYQGAGYTWSMIALSDTSHLTVTIEKPSATEAEPEPPSFHKIETFPKITNGNSYVDGV